MLLRREGASSAAPQKVWFTSRQLQISLVKQSRCAATTVRAGKLCICQQHPGQRRVARLLRLFVPGPAGGSQGGVWLRPWPVRERGPGQMGQQMDKRAEPLICCTRGEKKPKKPQQPGHTRGRERERRAAQRPQCTVRCKRREGNNRRLPDPRVKILTATLFTVTNFRAANGRLAAKRWHTIWSYKRFYSRRGGGNKAF